MIGTRGDVSLGETAHGHESGASALVANVALCPIVSDDGALTAANAEEFVELTLTGCLTPVTLGLAAADGINIIFVRQGIHAIDLGIILEDTEAVPILEHKAGTVVGLLDRDVTIFTSSDELLHLLMNGLPRVILTSDELEGLGQVASIIDRLRVGRAMVLPIHMRDDLVWGRFEPPTKFA